MPIRFLSWNVNGVRAIQKKGFWESLKVLSPDVFSLQETKSDSEIMSMQASIFENQGYQIWYHSATMKKGYSGVATGTNLGNLENSSISGGLFADLQIATNKPASTVEITSKEIQVGIGDPEFDIEGRAIITEHLYKNYKIALLNGYHPQGGRGPHRIEYKILFFYILILLLV